MLGRLLILFILLGFQAFGQVALTITVQFRAVAILAQHTGNVVPIYLIIRDCSQRTDAGQQYGEQEYIDDQDTHRPAKVHVNAVTLTLNGLLYQTRA